MGCFIFWQANGLVDMLIPFHGLDGVANQTGAQSHGVGAQKDVLGGQKGVFGGAGGVVV